MSVAKTNAEHQEATRDLTHEPSTMDEKHNAENVTHVEAASVALAAAMAAQKPSLLSKGMIRLYGIMAIGYLVSTMNGFGKFPHFVIRSQTV